ncbi:hypothetical protein CC2G_005064 [Coprinopsis cinerea AmutBmut pab1-1]|nr:hypothetical protein CC2G_005064 [Coprinopsis cinerea AmutBmut pab1-1]
MMKSLASLLILAFSLGAYAAENGPCNIPGIGVGTCLPTNKCTEGGGGFWSGYCPNDPSHIKCCFKRCPGPTGPGTCRNALTCSSGRTLTGYCPGPAINRCCMPS